MVCWRWLVATVVTCHFYYYYFFFFRNSLLSLYLSSLAYSVCHRQPPLQLTSSLNKSSNKPVSEFEWFMECTHEIKAVTMFTTPAIPTRVKKSKSFFFLISFHNYYVCRGQSRGSQPHLENPENRLNLNKHSKRNEKLRKKKSWIGKMFFCVGCAEVSLRLWPRYNDG